MERQNAQPRERVVHITTVHPPFDVRIFEKEARSLARAGYEVVLLAPHAERAAVDGVQVVPVSRPDHRLGRILLGPWRAYFQARRIPAALYHLHDPELLVTGWLLVRSGRRVIYDAHEDTPAQILDKEWIWHPLRRTVAWLFDRFERRVAAQLAAVVTATEGIARRLPGAVVVHNYPDLTQFPSLAHREPHDDTRVVYVGGLSRVRGARQMVEAVGALRSRRVTLELIGPVEPETLKQELASLPGYSSVRLHGKKSWRDSWECVCREGDVGLLVYQPARNHVEALPTKLFEYMAAGLPVIASDFPLWREIVEGAGAGLLVDPRDPQAIATAIDRLAADPELRRVMGQRARRAAEVRYNWAPEAEKLLALYREVLSEDH